VTKDRKEPQELAFTTWLLCRELHSDDNWMGHAVAAPQQASFGSDAHVLVDFETFLSEFLVTQPPHVVARFALPEEIELREVTVVLRRPDLPHRLQIDMPISFPCILVPQGRDVWVMLPTLDHTFYLPRGDELEPAVRSEVKRIVEVLELGERGYLGLLPAADHQLVPLPLSMRHGGEGLAGRAAATRKAQVEEQRRKSARELLESVAVSMHESVGDRGPELVGRKTELDRLTRLFSGDERSSVVLVGEPGCGKSELIRQWLRPRREDRLVYSTSAAELVAGMAGFGEWEERVNQVMHAVELLDAVLYFEDLGELLSDYPERGGIDMAGAIRRYVIDGRVRLLGELNSETLAVAARRQAALFSAMHRVTVEPLTKEQSVTALRSRVAFWNARDPARPRVERDLVRPVVDLADRYIPYRAFPGKAIGFVEELRATYDARVRTRDNQLPSIGLEEAYEAFSLTSGIPAFLLRDDRRLLANEVKAKLGTSMVGQDEAVRLVVDTLCVVKAQLQPTGRPLATFLFAGPTGVGKTELARTLARFLFGDTDRMARFDMSEYADAWAAERLIRGTTREEGLLTSRVRAQPFCVLLLDEIEKAHPAVFDLLLQVCGEGRLTDARGRTTYFHNAIIVMTSNLGSTHGARPIGMAASAEIDADRYVRAVHDTFRPELINRLDRIVPFHSLTGEQVEQITGLLIAQLEQRRGFVDAGVTVEVTPAAVKRLATDGFSETYGARALRRVVDRSLVSPSAQLLARLGGEARGSLLWIGGAGETSPHGERRRFAAEEVGPLRFELFHRPAAGSRTALRGVFAVADMRRQADQLMAMDEALRVREECSFIRSQLATAGERGKKKRPGADIGQLHARLHRLNEAWERADRGRNDLRAAEDLVLSALLGSEEARTWVDEARDILGSFRTAFFYLLSAHRDRRDAVTLMAMAPDGGDPMSVWLGPLLEECSRRRWRVSCHVRDNEHRQAGWPSDRVWGPPRDTDWALNHVVSQPGSHKAVLLRVRGPDAAVLLGLEAGLHRFTGYSADKKPHHLIVSLLRLADELTDEQWRWQPEWPGRPARATVAVRERAQGDDVIRVEKERLVELDHEHYWRSYEEVGLEHLLLHIERDTLHALYRETLPETGSPA